MRHSTCGKARKLTEPQIAELLARRENGETYPDLAARFGVAAGTAWKIVKSGGTHYKRLAPLEPLPW